MSLIEIIILIALVAAFGVFMYMKSKNKAADSAGPDNQFASREKAAVMPGLENAPTIQAGIDDETVAVIMAAISCLTDSDTGMKYTVRSINRVKNERPVWCFAGMQQNTRPF